MANILNDDFFMKEAIKEAKKALVRDEVPIGAVIVCNDQVIARAHNLTETLNDVTAHAEMQAFTAAENHIGAKYLNECTLYVTTEPCPMCAGAAYWTQIGRIVYGAEDKKRGFLSKNLSVLHPKTKLTGGVLESECSDLLIDFFKRKRNPNS
ncbi:MAG: nucleoside deaminase [Bacteroidota bacterium]